MSNSKMFLGSLCLTDLNEQAKKGHSAFIRGKNGKVYVNVCHWLNSAPDSFGNTHSTQLSSKKDCRLAEGKVYLGNAKEYKQESGFPVNARDTAQIPDDDDLPF